MAKTRTVYISYEQANEKTAVWLKKLFKKNGITCGLMAVSDIPENKEKHDKLVGECRFYLPIVTDESVCSAGLVEEIGRMTNAELTVLAYIQDEPCEDSVRKEGVDIWMNLSDSKRYNAFDNRTVAAKEIVCDIWQGTGKTSGKEPVVPGFGIAEHLTMDDVRATLKFMICAALDMLFLYPAGIVSALLYIYGTTRGGGRKFFTALAWIIGVLGGLMGIVLTVLGIFDMSHNHEALYFGLIGNIALLIAG